LHYWFFIHFPEVYKYITSYDAAVLGLEVNHPYVAVAVGDSTLQVHLTAERFIRQYK
jgi:hypothetical protein